MSTTTLYMPIESPPTPAPSPGPPPEPPNSMATYFLSLTPPARLAYLSNIIAECTPSELLFISSSITPRLKRDFLKELPPEIALHILEYVDDPRTLGRIACVSKPWRQLLQDEHIWKLMCERFGYNYEEQAGRQMAHIDPTDEPLEELEKFANIPLDPALEWLTARKRQALIKSVGPSQVHPPVSYRQFFKYSYTTMQNYISGGTLLRTHLLPPAQPANEAQNEDSTPASAGTVTSAAMDSDWLVVGLANTKIHVFSARTGVLARTLVGHDLGVWAVSLVSKGGGDDRPDGIWVDDEDADADVVEDAIPKRFRAALGLDQRRRRYVRLDGIGKKSDPCGASDGWGQPNALVVSSGCDKVVRVWDVKTGHCIHTLIGHSSTIRCIRVFHNRPIAVTGSRDATLRVWDIQRGRMLRVLTGHSSSVRCIDVCSNVVVSGSYDNTCRVWDVDTGHCIHVLEGHYHQIYSVAFDGYRIASGGLDTTVRIWDPHTGKCVALLQSHTALVCQLQLSSNMLCTGGSDGRVITFSLPPLNPDLNEPPPAQPYGIVHRLAAHDSSVTALQFNSRFLLTAGNDGRVRLHDTQSGMPLRELGGESESVWKVVCRWEEGICAVMAKRAGRSVLEVWSFKGE